jgi:predicted metal-dependent phosphoesterase TrpH
VRLANPYERVDFSKGLRTNLHMHTTQSDGAAEPQAMIDAYAEAGFDAVMMSDHDVFTDEARYSQWDARGMALIPGTEISRAGPHVLQIGGIAAVPPHADRQRVLDEILAAGAVAVMNHPNWFKDNDHCAQELLQSLSGYHAIEIFNAKIGELQGTAYATERWDRLLGRGRRIWGMANDDAHSIPGVGQGYNVVFAADRTAGSVISALRDGCFYASTGVVIDRLEVAGDAVTIAAAAADRIVAIMDWGVRTAVADAPQLTVRVPQKATYIRFECWGRGERFAWTQPLFVQP